MRSRLLLPSSLGFSPDARNRSDPSSLLPPPSGFSPTHAGPRYHIHPHHRHASTPDRCPQENSLLQIVHKTGPGSACAATVVARATGETDRLRMARTRPFTPHLAVYLIRFCKWPGTRRFSSPGTPAKFIAWHGESHRSPSHRCGRLCEWLVRRKDVRPWVRPSSRSRQTIQSRRRLRTNASRTRESAVTKM